MKFPRENQQWSDYEIKVQLNEKIYRGHFSMIENIKKLLKESEKEHDLSDDPRLKEKYRKIINKAKKTFGGFGE